MKTKKILVTGADSQLGKTLKNFSSENFEFNFLTKKELDITDKKAVRSFFETNEFDYCLNFAAYTDVEKAEKEKKVCFKVNKKGVKNLAKAARRHRFVLIHISTDYVFDGLKKKPYNEKDKAHPLNVYGASKLAGEKIIRKYLKQYYIIRTSWLYSPYNRNFVKTILKLAQTKNKLNLINDQTGTPTYAKDLIEFILFIIKNNELKNNFISPGIYHFSNKGKATWYDFAREILSYSPLVPDLKPVSSEEFSTEAKRPAYSVLSKKKIKNNLNYKPRRWEKALKEFIREEYKNYDDANYQKN